MKKKVSSRDGSLSWAIIILSMAFASLAISFLISQNDELSARIESLKEALATEVNVPPTAAWQANAGIRDSACGENDGECLYLIDDAYYPTGLATVEGYYDGEVTTTDWDGNEVVCNTFLVTGGSELLLKGFQALDVAGSGVLAQDMSGNIMLNINLDDVSDAEQQIISASEDNKVTLNVFVPQPGDVGVPACHSPFTILEIAE